MEPRDNAPVNVNDIPIIGLIPIRVIGGTAGELIGAMYFRCTLDNLIELAYKVSIDFTHRPHLYKNCNVTDELVSLQMSYGHTTGFPNLEQRRSMYIPIFGKSDGAQFENANFSAFHQLREKLIESSKAYSERVHETGLQMLEERVRSANIPLNNYLSNVNGRALQASFYQINNIFQIAIRILRNQDVARAFGVGLINGLWPFQNNDPNGAMLVELIGTNFKNQSNFIMTHDKFVLLQRVASEGQLALNLVLSANLDAPDQLRELITRTYVWGSSLRNYTS